MSKPRPPLRWAYSPDADDAFMAFGLETAAVPTRGLTFQRETADIETLNRRARAGELDVTAVSFAAWPHLADRYDLLPVGSSFGLGYGPKVVALSPQAPADLRGRRVAVPGALTSAALTLALCAPEAIQVPMGFEGIPAAVAAGDVEAGVVIHEGQLTYPRFGLQLVVDLGAWWSEQTGGLPLPLGANVVRRALPREDVATLVAVLRDSIAHAQAHRAEALRHALRHGCGPDVETADRFVAMYVNELTLDPGPQGRRAVATFYERAAEAGLLPKVTPRWA